MNVGDVIEFRFYRNRGDWKIGVLVCYEETPRWEANWQVEYPVFNGAKARREGVVDYWQKTPWMKRDLVRPIEWVVVK